MAPLTMRLGPAEVKDAAATVTAFGFVGACIAYALGAFGAFLLRLEVDLVALATKSGFVIGFGTLCGYIFHWTGLAD
jgi:hypothetical protein